MQKLNTKTLSAKAVLNIYNYVGLSVGFANTISNSKQTNIYQKYMEYIYLSYSAKGSNYE